MRNLILSISFFFLIATVTVKGESHNHYQHQPQESAHEPEIDALKCPSNCVCQYAHFGDLPIARWINHMQSKQPKNKESSSSSSSSSAAAETDINNNEAVYEGDESFLTNPFIKQATCILQEDNNPSELVNSLPHDLQALVLLYTGMGRNKTVPTSILQPLNQLTTLEIRGPQDRSFKLIIDEPMSFLQHANFESITLLGSDTFKRPKNPVHPRESFKYIPNSERIATYNEAMQSDEGYNENPENLDDNDTEEDDDDIEILPYDVYLMEVKKSRMATFYGWENLEVLRIHHCKMDELHWEMFDGLNSLQHLSLDYNGIKSIPAFALYGALHIKTLSLANNLISDLHYRSLAGLLELEMLDLSDNRLTKLSELTFPPFPNLIYIDFRNNPIRYIFPATFGVMNKTETMLFGSKSVALELWGNMPFEALKELQRLSIENVSIGVLEHNIFQGLISLRTLKLKGDIRSIEFDAFADMIELRELDLSDCKLREISMDSFMGCKKLEIVNLSNNNLSYIPPGLFDDQTILEEVYLQQNNLRYLPSTFFNNPSMKLVRLTDNPWKCSCDMIMWKPKITNQERGPKMERCIKMFHTGKTVSCHQVDNYKFDNKLSPRCANQNGRSVYYVLRRILQCHHSNRKRIATTPTAMKYKYLDERRDRHKEKVQQKKQFYKSEQQAVNDLQQATSRLAWQKMHKMQKNIATHRNSIDFLINNNQNIQQNKQLNKDDVSKIDEISNNI